MICMMSSPILLQLPEEIILSISSYLSTHDIRSLASTCRSTRATTILHKGAADIWVQRMRESFPGVFHHTFDPISAVQEVTFVDNCHYLPVSRESLEYSEVNISLLACLLPSRYPKTIDANTLTSEPSTPFRSFQLNIGGDICKAKGIPAQETVIQFTGQVGTGARCLRADSPFPPKCCKVSSSRRSLKGVPARMKKKGRTPNTKKLTSASLGDQSPMNHFLSSLSRPASVTPSRNHHDNFRPFVVPTVLSRSTNGLHHGVVVDLTPRMVAYFEVSIIKQEPSSAPKRINQEEASVQHYECVAIGLSTEAFCPDDRMPGWDEDSYGYHSDDGGLFHGNNAGAHQHRHAAPFGKGDTVGCGIEYSTRRIFFTKNGEFLGFEFKKVSKDILNKGLYPTVGVDTGSPLFMNLGEQPFKFDLKRVERSE